MIFQPDIIRRVFFTMVVVRHCLDPGKVGEWHGGAHWVTMLGLRSPI